MTAAPKVYDQAYFDRWYRHPRRAVIRRGVLERRVRLAVAAAEYLLDRRVASVLDIGCGEAPWRGIVKRLRPGARYAGVDSSEYAVRRFARTRGVRYGRFGKLGHLGLRGPFDLVVCSDVLHYVADDELLPGLVALRRLLGGVAFLEIFTAEDDVIGDDVGFQARSEARYRRLLRAAGLMPIGLHAWVGPRLARRLLRLERVPVHRKRDRS
jgi:SAM-dependent methyltransferase